MPGEILEKARVQINENGEFRFRFNKFQEKIWFSIFDKKGELREDMPEELASFGGYGNGKSCIYLIIAYYLCMKFKGLQLLFCRQYLPQLRDSAVKQFLAIFPEHICSYNYVGSPVPTITFLNGSQILFRGFSKRSIKKILSTEYDLAMICQVEETQKDLILEIMGRLRSTLLYSQILMVEGNPDPASWCLERYKTPPLPLNCIYLEAPTSVNKNNLNPAYEARLRREYSDAWVEQKIYGQWNTTRGLVHPDFGNFNEVNPFEVKDHWFKAIGMDHGYVAHAGMLWGAVDEEGRVYIYDEFYKTHQRTYQLVEANRKYGPLPTPADTSMKAIKNIETGYGTLWDDLIRAGVNLISVPKHKNANIQLVNTLIHQRRLFVSKKCVHLLKEIKAYRWKTPELGAEENAKEEVVKKDDHLCDALQYLIRYLSEIKVISLKKKAYHNTLAYHTRNTYNSYDKQWE